MSQSSENSQDDFAILVSTVQMTLDHLNDWWKPVEDNSSALRDRTEINVLDLAHNTASLIRAQSTKLCLLIHNKPFPPSAPTKVLQQLISGPIPDLVFIAQLCDPKRYTKTMSRELDYRINKLIAELIKLVKAIPLDRELPSNDINDSQCRAKEEKAPITIGTTWEACDALIELKTLGIAGLFIRKSEEYRDLLQDALEELQGWAEEDSDVEDDSEQSGEYSAQAAVDLLFGSQKHIPNDDPDRIRPRLLTTTKRLRLLILMFQAVIKRRFETFPSLPNFQHESESENKTISDLEIVKSLDHVLETMKKISDITDDLASAFYDLDLHLIDLKMEECFSTGSMVPGILLINWDGKQDSFSSWVIKFQAAMTLEKETFNALS